MIGFRTSRVALLLAVFCVLTSLQPAAARAAGSCMQESAVMNSTTSCGHAVTQATSCCCGPRQDGRGTASIAVPRNLCTMICASPTAPVEVPTAAAGADQRSDVLSLGHVSSSLPECNGGALVVAAAPSPPGIPALFHRNLSLRI